MRMDVREFIRRLEAAGLAVESTRGYYHVLHDGKPLRKANGVPFTLPFSPEQDGDPRSAQARHRAVAGLWIAGARAPETCVCAIRTRRDAVRAGSQAPFSD